MNTNTPLPAHLERIGDQLVAAAESLYGAAPGLSRRRAQRQRAMARFARAPRLALAGCVASLATAAVVVAVFATAGTPPAYALTQNSNGTYTVTINDITTGVPALNAKLKQLGINATAVPVTTTCTATAMTGGSSSLTERIESQLSPALATAGSGGLGTVGSGGLIGLDQADIPAGDEGVIAASQSPSGQINLTFWTTSGSIPSCLNTNQVVPSNPATSSRP